MTNKKLLCTGTTGTVITAICCVTPVLLVLFGAVGLTAWLGWIDYVLFPARAVFLGITVSPLRARPRKPEGAASSQGLS